MFKGDIGYYSEIIKDIQFKDNAKIAIYGTGESALFVAQLFLEIGKEVSCFIDKDDSLIIETQLMNLNIHKLNDVYASLDYIIIAAPANHMIISNRLNEFYRDKDTSPIIVDLFYTNSINEERDFLKYICNKIIKDKSLFEPIDKEGIVGKPKTRILAWYLPQFHQFDINNSFHGQGFTDWINSSSAIPLYTGHYQPHIPYDVGYYDLLNIDTIKRQAYLARLYGIYGFCIHYYWFSGKKVMEGPLQLLLANKDIDIHYCLNWANENWSKLWDGGNKEIILEQTLEENDAEKLAEDLLPYFRDDRYIRIEGKPLLVIYRASLFQQERQLNFISQLREVVKSKGLSGIYIMYSNAFEFEEDVENWGGDALVEYQPHGIVKELEYYIPKGYINPLFNGRISDASNMIKEKRYLVEHKSKTFFRSAMTPWDNTARKAISGGHIITGITPELFYDWIVELIKESCKLHSSDKNYVFINSWNEWAEGSHLEPDSKYGYAYLNAVKQALINAFD